jgi:hypothetical protein
MLTCNLRRPHRSMNGSDARRWRNPPGSGFICDLNGKIEYVVSKRVARSSSEIKLRCEAISMLPERIEGVACKWKINYDGNFEPQITLIEPSFLRRKRGPLMLMRGNTDLGNRQHLGNNASSPYIHRGSHQEALRIDPPSRSSKGMVPI